MSKAFEHAVRYLARRDHGTYELTQKLAHQGYEGDDIQAAIAECQRLDLQSDARFAQSLCRTRVRQGYGPLKITRDLQQVRIDKTLIEETLADESHAWLSYAAEVIHKKYGRTRPDSYAAIQKQKQFLLYRGFSMDIIHQMFKEEY